jgi:hypothetical protein
MKNKILINITIIALLSVTFCMFMPPLSAQGSAGVVESKPIVGGIIIDGISEEEWHDAKSVSFTLFDFDSPELEREISIASLCNRSTLFLWITVDGTESDGEFYLTFQSTSEPIIIDHTIPWWSTGNDVKNLASNNNTNDGFWSTDKMSVSDDASQDFDGKCYIRSGGFDFEMAMPLNSSDANGGDISLIRGDSINMFPTYITDGATGIHVFSLIHSTNGIWEQILIETREPSVSWKIPSYSIPILIFSMLAVGIFLIFKHYPKE